eukprot:1316877-Rhodomonas_salina.1
MVPKPLNCNITVQQMYNFQANHTLSEPPAILPVLLPPSRHSNSMSATYHSACDGYATDYVSDVDPDTETHLADLDTPTKVLVKRRVTAQQVTVGKQHLSPAKTSCEGDAESPLLPQSGTAQSPDQQLSRGALPLQHRVRDIIRETTAKARAEQRPPAAAKTSHARSPGKGNKKKYEVFQRITVGDCNQYMHAALNGIAWKLGFTKPRDAKRTPNELVADIGSVLQYFLDAEWDTSARTCPSTDSIAPAQPIRLPAQAYCRLSSHINGVVFPR